MTETYVHHFWNGLVAKATVTDDPPGFRVEWSSEARREILGSISNGVMG